MNAGFQYDHSKQNQRFSDIVQELRGLLLPIKGYENMPLVSLEESIMPLIVLIPDIHTYVYMAKENNGGSPAEGLTLDESAAICLYSMEWEPHDQCFSRVLNQSLRSKDRQKLNSWYLYLKLILTALTHLPSISSEKIYRGIKSDLSQDYPQGKKFIWWGFSSCTASLSVLQSIKFIGKTGLRTMFVIECPSGRNISQHTYFQSEEEVLIPPATRFVVTSCENPSNGLQIISLKEIPPPFTLLEPILHRGLQEKRRSIDQNSIRRNSQLEQLIDENVFSSSINLTREQLIDQDIPIVIEHGMIQKRCTLLDLTGNEITFEGATCLANALNNNSTLQELILYNNRLGDKGVRLLAFELSINNNTLKKLNLGFNEITDDGAQHLAQMLKTNRTLTHLWLQENHIGDRGTQLLAGVLARHNWTLELLALYSNKLLSDLSVNAMLDMLRMNQSLQQLNIDHCSLTEVGEAKLQEMIQSKKDFQLMI